MEDITLEQAQRVVAGALQFARERAYAPLAVVVLDVAGHIKALAREDGASMFRTDVAQAKAWGAVGMGVSSRVLGQRAKDNPNFFQALAATAQGRLLPQTGAVLIRGASGAVIGAVGASGALGDEDEAACAAGVAAAGLRIE